MPTTQPSNDPAHPGLQATLWTQDYKPFLDEYENLRCLLNQVGIRYDEAVRQSCGNPGPLDNTYLTRLQKEFLVVRSLLNSCPLRDWPSKARDYACRFLGDLDQIGAATPYDFNNNSPLSHEEFLGLGDALRSGKF